VCVCVCVCVCRCPDLVIKETDTTIDKGLNSKVLRALECVLLLECVFLLETQISVSTRDSILRFCAPEEGD